MTSLLIGSVLNRPPGNKYSHHLNFAELDIKNPLPRPSTLRRWRHDTPSNIVFSLRAPQSAIISESGPLRFDRKLEEGLEWTLDAAEALEAHAVIFSTPSEFSTSQRDRDLLAQFIGQLPSIEGRVWVWEPKGLWDEETSYPLAEKLGLIRAFDPLKSPLPPGNIAYARLIALGVHRHISEAMLQRAIEVIRDPSIKKAYASITSGSSFQQAIRLQHLACIDHQNDEPSFEL